MALPNIYHHRRVADSAAKACYVCYKPTSSVLATPDNRDFFFTCPGHLVDRGFAIPLDANHKEIKPEDEEARRKKEELEKEIEKVKKEYEEKMAKKKSKKKDKDKDKDKDKEKKKKDDDEVDDRKEAKERDDKIKKLEKDSDSGSSPASTAPKDPGSRIFALHKNIYQMRVSRIQQQAAAKRQAERMRNLTFPTVPKTAPGAAKPPAAPPSAGAGSTGDDDGVS